MKVKVEFTVEVTDEQRRIIRWVYDGTIGSPATREQIKNYFEVRGEDGFEELSDYRREYEYARDDKEN